MRLMCRLTDLFCCSTLVRYVGDQTFPIFSLYVSLVSLIKYSHKFIKMHSSRNTAIHPLANNFPALAANPLVTCKDTNCSSVFKVKTIVYTNEHAESS